MVLRKVPFNNKRLLLVQNTIGTDRTKRELILPRRNLKIHTYLPVILTIITQ